MTRRERRRRSLRWNRAWQWIITLVDWSLLLSIALSGPRLFGLPVTLALVVAGAFLFLAPRRLLVWVAVP